MFFTLIAFHSCASIKQPVFKQLTNLKFNSWNNGNITLLADAEFENPNRYSVQLAGTDLNLSLDGKKAAQVQQEMDIKVPAAQSFKVPIKIDISTSDLSPDLLLGGAMAVLTNKKIPMHLDGSVTLKILKVKVKIPVNHDQQISPKELMRIVN